MPGTQVTGPLVTVCSQAPAVPSIPRDYIFDSCGEAGSGDMSRHVTRPHTHGDVMVDGTSESRGMARRSILRLGALGGAGLAFGAVQGVVKPSPRRAGLAVGRRRVRRDRRRAGRRALSRAVPDQPADPVAVQRPAADPQGDEAGAQERVHCLGRPAGTRPRPAELAAATSSTRSGRARSDRPTRSSTRSTSRSASTR